MTDSTPRTPETSFAGTWLTRGLPGPARGAGSSAPVSSAAAPDVLSGESGSDPSPRRQRDWSASLDLIREATAAIRISEDRASELEDELERTIAQSKAREAALEAQFAAAQNRADLAEQRAAEAEDWLARMHDAVVEGFTRPDSRSAAPSGASSAA